MQDFTCDDKIMRCPYNNEHIVPSSSFQRHIVKCEKKFPEDYLIICPYNATHRIKKLEIAEHITNCSSRKMIEANYIQQSHNCDSLKLLEAYSSSSAENNLGEKMEKLNYTSESSFGNEDESVIDDTKLFYSEVGIGRGRLMHTNTELPGRRSTVGKRYN